MKKIITNLNNIPTTYDILDINNLKICTCKPITKFDMNRLQFSALMKLYNSETGQVLQNNYNVLNLYEYIFASMIDWLYFDLNDSKIPCNKLNIKKYLELDMVIYISNKIVEQLKNWVDLNSKN